VSDSYPITLRSPCRSCGGSEGYTTLKGGNDMPFCLCEAPGLDEAGKSYCVPKSETGRAVRPLHQRPNISIATRSRVFEKWGSHCAICGGRPPRVELEVEHIFSRETAYAHGYLDWHVDSEYNLAPLCKPCNSGTWRTSGFGAVRLLMRAISIHGVIGRKEVA